MRRVGGNPGHWIHVNLKKSEILFVDSEILFVSLTRIAG
jgi:hypothetical protein